MSHSANKGYVLCCVVLYCIVLCCVVLFVCCVVFDCIVLHWNVLHCAVLCCVALGWIALCCFVLCCIVLCCTSFGLNVLSFLGTGRFQQLLLQTLAIFLHKFDPAYSLKLSSIFLLEICMSVDHSRRVECGWFSITEQQCVNRRCCYDDSTNGATYCFNKPDTNSPDYGE